MTVSPVAARRGADFIAGQNKAIIPVSFQSAPAEGEQFCRVWTFRMSFGNFPSALVDRRNAT